MNAAITAQKRFEGKRTLIITGERAEESAARAKYEVFGSHYYTNCKKRHVDHWRPVHKWKEQQVWDIIKRWNIRVHPCYHLGFNRCSCAACIFGNNDQWASINAVNPDQVKVIADYESEFKTTIHRKIPVMERVSKGTPYEMKKDIMALALSKNYYESIIMKPGEWEMPSGAFGEGCGPT